MNGKAKLLFQGLQPEAIARFQMDVPDFDVELVNSAGDISNETLASQAIYHCCLDFADEDRVSSLSGFISIALFGVPIWRFFLRVFLKRLAIWTWRELNR